MKKLLFLFSCGFLLCTNTIAQDDRSFGERLVFGGNLGLQFGNVTIIEVAPNVGYLINDWWLSGIGAKYLYLEDKDFNYSTSMYGGSVFNQFYFLEHFIAHQEIEVLNLGVYYPLSDKTVRENVTGVYVGGGARIPAGRNAFFTALVLYNLNQTFKSPYANPIIRVGIGIGF